MLVHVTSRTCCQDHSSLHDVTLELSVWVGPQAIFYQSINKSIDQSIDQSINQWTNQSMDQSIAKSIKQSTTQPSRYFTTYLLLSLWMWTTTAMTASNCVSESDTLFLPQVSSTFWLSLLQTRVISRTDWHRRSGNFRALKIFALLIFRGFVRSAKFFVKR